MKSARMRLALVIALAVLMLLYPAGEYAQPQNGRPGNAAHPQPALLLSKSVPFSLGNTLQAWFDGIFGPTRNLFQEYPLGVRPAWAATEYEYFTTGDGSFSQAYGVVWRGQTFTVGTTGHTITSVQLYLYRTGSPGTLTASLMATASGLPTGSALVSGTTDGNTLPASTPAEWRTISFTEYALTANTQYAIMLKALTGTSSNCVNVGRNTNTTYPGGSYVYSTNGGSSYGSVSTWDFMFQVWGNPTTAPWQYEYYNTGDDAAYQSDTNYWHAQTFTVGATAHTITSVKLLLYQIGSPGTVTVSIKAVDVNGNPTGSDLTSGTTNGDTLPTSAPYEWRQITLTEYTLSANTKYAIVIRASALKVMWRHDQTSPTYGGGNIVESTDSGATWTGYTTIDCMFEVWGNPAYQLTVTSAQDSPTGAGGYSSGTSVSSSVTSPWPVGATGTRYVCTGWTGTGSAPSSGTGTSTGPFLITQASSVTWNWKTQYQLTVTSAQDTPTPYVVGTTWVDEGSVTESVTTPASGGTGTQYVSTGWSGTGSVPSTGTANTVTFTIASPSTITWNWKTQYQLTVTSPQDTPTPYAAGTSWVNAGSVTESVTPTVSGGSGIQYVSTGWTGTGSVPSSGSGTSVTFTMSAASSITWNWRTQYYLTVSSTYGTPGGGGWYDSGATPSATVTPLTVPGATGVQYVFDHWSGDASGSGSPSNPITMNAPKTATANWRTQYYLTVTSTYGTPGGGGWKESDSTPTATVNPLTVPGTPGVQYVFDHWGGDASGSGSPSDPITMNAPKTAVATWKTRYQLTVAVSPALSGTTNPTVGSHWYDAASSVPVTALASGSYVLDYWSLDGGNVGSLNPYTVTMGATHELVANFAMGTASVTITSSPTGSGFVMVDGAAYSTPHAFTWTVGSVHNLTALSPVSGGAGVQYVWQSWNDTGTQMHDYTVPGSDEIVTATYKTQYRLTISASPPSSGTTDPVMDSYWYDSGSGVQVTASPLGSYVFNYWSLDGGNVGSSNQYTVTTSAPHDLVANFVMGTVSITVTSSPTGSGFVMVDGVAHSTPHSFTWTISSQHNLTALSPVEGFSGVRYVWQSWNDTGTQMHDYTVPASSETVTATYGAQYQLTISLNPLSSGTTDPVMDSYWYDSGSGVQVTASPLGSYVFNYWSLDGGNVGSSNQYTVTTSAPHDLVANFVMGTVPVTINSDPAGSDFVMVDGTAYSTPHAFTWTVGSVHNLTALSPVGGVSGVQYLWQSWNDTGSQTHDYTVPPSSETVTATYKTQYLLTISASPPGSGFTVPTAGSYWYDSGSGVQVTASPLGSYVFNYWSLDGGNVGNSNPYTVTMSVVHDLVANFVMGTVSITVTSSPTGSGFVMVDGAAYSTPHAFTWTVGSVHNLTALSPVGGVSGVQYLWQSWNDTGSQTHLVTVLGAPTIYVADYQTQYWLTMGASPSGAGSTTPITGWQNAGDVVSLSASIIDPSYVFHDWSGSGSDSYSGSDNPASITMSNPITELAEFTASSPAPVTMTVSYQIVGNGSPTAPTFNYYLDHVLKHSGLNLTATPVLCDGGLAWSVTPNPISGSASEQWYANPTTLSGTASTRAIVFSFQHQYKLTMQKSPTGGGTISPSTGWKNAGDAVSISASASSGYQFQSWTGSGSSSYSGSDNPASITMNSAVTETANFESTGPAPPPSACRFSGSASIEDTSVFSIPLEHNSPLSMQQLLLPLSLVLPTSGLAANRRARRGMKGLLLGGRHGGLSGLASVIILVVLVASAIIGVAAYYYGIGSGAMSQSHMIFSGSVIKVNSSTDTGTVYIKLYNAGSGGVRVRSINVTAESGDFGIDFSSGTYGVVSVPGCNCTISSGTGVGMGGSSGNGFLSLPAGTTTSMMIVFNTGMTTYFEPGTQYQALVVPVQAAEMPFTIPSEGGQ